MVATGQDNVLGSVDLSRKRYELKEKYETLEQENFVVENELAELHAKLEISEPL